MSYIRINVGDCVPECIHCGKTIAREIFEQAYDAQWKRLLDERRTHEDDITSPPDMPCPHCGVLFSLSRERHTYYGCYLTDAQREEVIKADAEAQP